MTRFPRLFSFGRAPSPEMDESDTSVPRNSISETNPASSTPSSSSSSLTLPNLIIGQNPLVLLMYWPQNIGADNLSEVNRMEAVFRIHYRYTTSIIEIDQQDPFNSVNDVLARFQRELRNPDQLLIMYYIGHGKLGDGLRFEMSPEPYECQNPMTLPKLDWSTIQVILQHLDCDVLILLDTCYAASTIAASRSSNSISRGRTEVIAACGYEAQTPGLSRDPAGNPHTFSRALAAELHRLSTSPGPFSAAMLYRGILEGTVVDFTARLAGLQEWFSMPLWKPPTPVHVVLGNSWGRPSIPLEPVRGLSLMASGLAGLAGLEAGRSARGDGDAQLVRDDLRGSRPSAYAATQCGG